jgi:hypothetical protein
VKTRRAEIATKDIVRNARFAMGIFSMCCLRWNARAWAGKSRKATK